MAWNEKVVPETGTYVTHLVCSLKGDRYPADQAQGLSKAGKPLLVRYDLEALAAGLTKEMLAARAGGFWRYREFLPVRARENVIDLGEVMTPLIRLDRLEPRGGCLLVKDEGRLPTGSSKARGLALAVAMAAELGLEHLAMASNGNAGAAMAAYASRAGLRATVFCPADAPEIDVCQAALAGATVFRVDGLIDDCGRLVQAGTAGEGWLDCSTLREPYRIEGKKTMGLELAEQLDWTLPDVIFHPTGGGAGLIGMWKAFAELAQVGWIGEKRPRMVAVQAEGCAPLVRAYDAGRDEAKAWEDAHTVAAGIRVPAAIGDFLVLQAVRESGGFAIAVPDEVILAARDEVARAEGLLLSPEGAAAYAAYRRALDEGRVLPNERAVLVNCAVGLKFPLPSLARLWEGEIAAA